MTAQAPASPATARPAASRAEMDRMLADLKAHADGWLAVPLSRKVELLDRLRAGTLAVAERQVQAAARAKGIATDSPRAGEEWLGGPMITVRLLRLLARSLREVAAGRLPRPVAVRTRPDGQVVAQVFPGTLFERLLFAGFTAEIWMQPGVTEASLAEHQAASLRQPPARGQVALVLGAGNVASIGPLDVVHKLFVEGQVVLLKMNPVNEYLGPFVEESFAPLVEGGWLRVAYGGADVGAYLVEHPGVDTIHITGSDRTHDAIVFGPGPEGAERKKRREPRLSKPITSELGNVSPIVVVPGEWSPADLEFQAANIATQMINNAGFNCNAAKVLVVHESWPQRRALLDAVRRVLASVPARPAYYPGAEDRWERFVGAHPEAEKIGQRRPGELPWTLIPGVDPDAKNEPCFTTESFCSVMAETALPAGDARAFLAAAVRFCNESLWGTLNAGILVHPRTQAELGEALEEAIAGLRYGTVALNHWAALAYGLGVTTWGAWPGHTLEDIQSGIGVVHNTLLYDRPEKSVIRGPFRVSPYPAWFVTHRQAQALGRKLTAFEARPSAFKLPGIVWSALRG